MKRVLIVLLAAFAVAGCGGKDNPAEPTSTTTRIIGLSGNLAFGNVTVGQSADATLTIQNSGNALLTITGITGPSASAFTSSFTSGTVAAGALRSVTIRFTPGTAQAYSGTLTINGDQTSGTNTISISGTGVAMAPPPAPTNLTLIGTVTDGFSRGALPNITVQIVSGPNAGRLAVTDPSGSYSISGLTGGTFTLSAANSGYDTQTQQVTLTANTRVDIILPRTGSSPPGQGTCPASAYPAGTTAVCNNGSLSQSQNRSGTCSSNGGVRCWICPGILCNGIAVPLGSALR